MKIEAGFFTFPNVFVHAESSECYAFDLLFLLRVSNHIVAAAIGQANVTQEHIKLFRIDNFLRALGAIGNRDVVTKMGEQAGQSAPRIAMIFH